jgi:hypothetical protein
VGTVLVADEIAHGPLGAAYGALYAIPFALAYVVYRFAINAAWRWGVEMRASTDLHRLEVYERLGLRRPKSFTGGKRVSRRATRGAMAGCSGERAAWRAAGDALGRAVTQAR